MQNTQTAPQLRNVGAALVLAATFAHRYASWPAHQSAVRDLQLLADCAISVSSHRVVLSANGGYNRTTAHLSGQVGWR